jgi:hypothetical protein
VLVTCPHAGPIAPETTAALDASGFPWEAADVSESQTSYTRLLERLWAAGKPFAVVEHDIVPHPGALAGLAACPEPWCAFPYQLGGIMHAGLGCARFSASLLAAAPGAVERTWAESTDVHPPGFWCALDDRLSRSLRREGYARHVHGPPVAHLNPVPSHGCTDLGGDSRWPPS